MISEKYKLKIIIFTFPNYSRLQLKMSGLDPSAEELEVWNVSTYVSFIINWTLNINKSLFPT